MAKIKLANGKYIADGDEVTLTLWTATHLNAVTRATEEISKTISGTVHSYEQVERIYDDEGIAVGKTTETHWELLTGDPNYPAIGFLPETSKLQKA